MSAGTNARMGLGAGVRSHLSRALLLVAAAAAVLAGVSCGGGVVGSGGTGRSPGTVAGTVNGFGSVIVDGVTYDDRDAPRVEEVAPGQDMPVGVKLGQRVSVDYETAGVATLLRVDPTLIGTVASVAADRLTVFGQTVLFNTTGATGPQTQFGGGYAQAADVTAGDSVAVHGVLVKQAGAYVVQATRVDKLSALPPYVRVTGVLTAVGAARLSIGALEIDTSGAVIVPNGSTPRAGQTVSVWALASTLTMPAPGSWQLHAAQVRIRELKAKDSELDDVVSGAVSSLDPQAKTFMLGSLAVNYAAATLSGGTLADGDYVRVRGMADAGGTLQASSVDIRDAGVGNESELRGNISGYDAVTKVFTVRDVAVDASAATIESCPATGLANGLYVAVEGRLSSSGVVAGTVHCEDEPTGATVEREGTVSALDAANLMLTLTPEQGSAVQVQWTATTYFGSATPQTLLGKKIKVEGSLNGAVLVAKKIEADD